MKVLANTHNNTLGDGLINNLQGKEQDYFFRMYDMYAASLYGLLLKWVKEKETAEILLHNAFERAWHNRKLFDVKTENVFYWLCRMARICYNERVKNL